MWIITDLKTFIKEYFKTFLLEQLGHGRLINSTYFTAFRSFKQRLMIYSSYVAIQYWDS